MGGKLDALLGRKRSKAVRLRTLLGLASSRLSVLKNHRAVRTSQSRSDVALLLRLGQTQRALLRVEHVIKEQNMLDAFSMLETYINLLLERISLIENHNHRECPKELQEATAGLVFVSSRCGDFPELQEIRSALASLYSREFTLAAAELRNNCGVNVKLIQKMSTALPSLESRIKATKEIASAEGIAIDVEEAVSETVESMLNPNKTYSLPKQNPPPTPNAANEAETGEPNAGSSASMDTRQRYKDAASAAQAAFESAAFAAEAARAAVELSRSGSHGRGSYNGGSEQEFSEKPKSAASDSSSGSDGEESYDERWINAASEETDIRSERVAFEGPVNDEAGDGTEGLVEPRPGGERRRPVSVRTRRGRFQ
ncbi:hypothetical protein QJS10_CPA09g00357 [Acorus calamus]|uniref:Uncharacterized protein n=1 Tax=Acorus calamus TaxID=4465 RepID=A0AAV9E3U1_ACOCL|nr:hypothetical protein QJS10_CPA09g00357 [Acorus calamus]